MLRSFRLLLQCSKRSLSSANSMTPKSQNSVNVDERPTDLSKLAQDLTKEYYNNKELIQEVITKQPELKNTSLYQWKSCVQNLSDYDFRIVDAFQMIARYPHLLRLPQAQLEQNLARWFDCNLGFEYFKFLLFNCPYLLHIDRKNIEQRIPYFRYITPSKKLLLILLVQCPNVMYEDWNSVTSKVDYLMKEMRVESEEMFRSLALSKSLDYIKMRHTILEKCGLYNAPSKWIHIRMEEKHEKGRFINAHLKRITDNAEISFARKIAKISEEEYIAFKNLWQLENDEGLEIEEEDYAANYKLHTKKNYINKEHKT